MKPKSPKTEVSKCSRYKGMKFTIINSPALIKTLSSLKAVTCKKGSIPVLENVSIVSLDAKTLKLSATDLDVTLNCQIEAVVSEPGSVLVPAAKLLDITRTYPNTTQLSFQALEQGGAKLTCEKATFKLVAPMFDSFPELPEPCTGAINIPANTFASMIDSTIFAITQEPSRYTLNGAKFELDDTSLRMITTDGHRLAKAEDTTITAPNKHELLIPQKALNELAKICTSHDGPVNIAMDDNHAYFHIGSTVLTARLLYGQFPSYENVIPKDNTTFFVADITLFRETVKRVSLMADDRSRSIRLEVKPNHLTITAEHHESGQGLEHLPIDFEGVPTVFAFNYEFILEALASIASSEKATFSFKDPESQVMIVPTLASTIRVANVVMPMRL